ncbi:protein mono-ADP-ribosyltransferase PARP14-like [Saccostrea cucullata]|uniref:protein mono-ADP-ribosyltransferase PARP14-like n=1 Tax=Saccostrea cuccullata TaxID=36930 RepID=UPI002ED252C3
MCSRESLSRRCVLVKQVPEGVEDDCVHRIRGVEKSHRHNELSIGNGEVRWIVLMRSDDEADKLIRDGHVTLDSGGQKLDLPVGGCPECIIPDDWVENTPTRASLSFDDEGLQDSIGMASIRCRENRSKSPGEGVTRDSVLQGSDDYVKVPKPISAEKPEETESTDKYVPTFVIPAISSPYSQLNQSDHGDSHLYSSLQSQYSEEVEFDNIKSTEETQTYTPRPPSPRADNSLPAKNRDEVNMKISITSKSRADEDSPYQSINEAAVRSQLGHDEPPPLPNRLGRSESREVPNLTYIEPVSRNGSHYDQLQSVVHSKQSNDNHGSWLSSQENSPGKFPVNSPSAASGDNIVKTGSGDRGDSPPVPQRLNRTHSSGVSSSTYIEPVYTGQVQSTPRTKPDIPQPGLKSGQGHSQAFVRNSIENTPNSGFPMNSHIDSNKFPHNAENKTEHVPSFGRDSSNTDQVTSPVLNDQRIQGSQAQQGQLDQRVMHRDSGSPIVRHQEPGYQRTPNQESGGPREINQTAGLQTERAQGIENQTPRNRETESSDALYQNVELFRRLEQGPTPGFMTAAQGQVGSMMNPQHQLGVMPPEQPNSMMNQQNQYQGMMNQHHGMMSPQNQHGAMPPGFMMGPQTPNQPIQGFLPFMYQGFRPPFFPFQQLPAQENMVPPTEERIPMPEPELPPPSTEGEKQPSTRRRSKEKVEKQSPDRRGKVKVESTERPLSGGSEERAPAQEEEEETEEETSFDTVKVRLRKPMSQDAIENYFENTRKSGGGDIESFKVIKEEDEQIIEALITFRQSSDAKSCLERKHTISGQNLTVEKYDENDPEKWEINKVLVSRLNPETTDDTLMNYLEPVAGVDPLEVVRGSEPDSAIVVFDEKPDFSKMSKRCKSKKLEGKTVFIQMVEKCRSVYAQDIDESITYDTVENFFCNKRRSGGGEVEEVDYHPEDGYCVVLFENPEDAENVASREKFTINGKEIRVQMLYSQLGLPEQPINWGDLPSIIYPCEKHFIKFVKNCEIVAKEIDKTMQQKFVKVEWPKSKSDFNVKLLCSVTKEVENARGILKKWKEEAEKSMESLVGKYAVQKHSILPEAWENFLEKLKMLNIDHPEKVAVSLEAKQHIVVVVGLEENAEALTRKILDIVRTEELKIKTQKEKIEKKVPLDFHKCQQLWKTQYQKKIKAQFPNVDMNIEIDKKEVNFSGKSSEVNEAMIKMHEYLMNTKSKSLRISKGRHEVLKSKDVRDSFLAEMKAKNNKAVWNVTEDKVEMTSSNMKMVEEALKVFEEFIPEKAIKVKQLVKVLTRHEWQACVKKLRDTHGDKMCILSSASEVHVTSTKDIFQPVCTEVEQVLEECSKKCAVDKKHVRLTEAQFNYVKYFGDKEMKKLTEEAKEKDLKITRNQEDHSIDISGNDEDVKKAKEELMKLVNRLSEDTYSITKPGAKAFFNSDKGREAIKRTGKATSCIIMNKEGGRHKKEERGSGSFERHGARSRSKFPVKMAECDLHISEKKLIVMKGDVTKLKVDVIVNAANGDLDHCGGLALAISKAGGDSVQKESKDYIKSNGTVSDGGAIPARPGFLPCQMLIHAVGPQWQGGNNEEEIKLRQAIMKCLELTDRNDYSSIAIPALSAGIFGYPVDQSVDTIVSSIQFYFKSKEGKSSKIKEIYFCDVDDKIVDAFIRCLKRKIGQDVKEFDGGEGNQSPSRDEDSDEEAHGKRRSSSSFDRKKGRKSSGDREKGMKIKVISGELAKMKVGYKLSSNTFVLCSLKLILSIGNISKSLSRAAGESLQDECDTKYKDGIAPGKVAITKGGDLRCRQVYHGTIKRWDHWKGDALGKLTDFVNECLRLADMNQMSSIAFPALGTGRLGYPPEQAAKTMFRCCREFHSRNRDTSLKEILFVIFYKDADILEAFRKESESGGAETGRPDYNRHRRERMPSSDAGSGDGRRKINKLNVEVRQGDITKERTDAIVNSITGSLDLTKGAASKAILNAAGDRILTECNRGAQSFSSEGYVVTSGGRMGCKYIIHVKAQRSAEEWERMVAKALAHADKTGCRSISFPALGTGVRNSDPADIAKHMFKAMRKFSPENLETVRVIVFQRDMVSVFQSSLDNLPQGAFTQLKDYVTGKIKDVIGSDEEEDDNNTSRPWRGHNNHGHGYRGQGHGQGHNDERITFLILSNCKENINKAKINLERILKSEFERKEIDVSKYTFSNSQIDEIKRLAKDTKIIVKEGKIELQGTTANVNEAAVAIYQYLHEVKDKESAKTVQKYVKWQYEVSTDKWSTFRDDVNLQIENAHQARKDSCTVKDNRGTEYVIDFKKMEEYEKNNYKKKYKIKRVDKGASSVGLPAKWVPMKNHQTMVEITLKPGDNEYKQVLSKFNASSQGSVSVSEKLYRKLKTQLSASYEISDIVEIRRVQNPYLYQQYAAKRKEIQVKNGKDPEQWLWHGTYPETVDKVINNGFNRSYCGRHGTSYGAGVYFAVNASYSLGYCKADSNGHKHMFSVQVATGDACRGNGAMNVLPPKAGAGSHVTYDSASDNPSNPVMYVIFHDSQAYPAYHIIFR